MAALMMYAALLVAYGLSVRSLLRQSHHGPLGDIATRQPHTAASRNSTTERSQPRRGSRPAAA
jgi:hypothetical protein